LPSVCSWQIDGQNFTSLAQNMNLNMLQFMHNGALADFHSFKRRLLSDLPDVAFNMVQGNTGSCFAQFIA
jgi:phage-related minor tail protein